jgi:hypothetical protein
MEEQTSLKSYNNSGPQLIYDDYNWKPLQVAAVFIVLKILLRYLYYPFR